MPSILKTTLLILISLPTLFAADTSERGMIQEIPLQGFSPTVENNGHEAYQIINGKIMVRDHDKIYAFHPDGRFNTALIMPPGWVATAYGFVASSRHYIVCAVNKEESERIQQYYYKAFVFNEDGVELGELIDPDRSDEQLQDLFYFYQIINAGSRQYINSLNTLWPKGKEKMLQEFIIYKNPRQDEQFIFKRKGQPFSYVPKTPGGMKTYLRARWILDRPQDQELAVISTLRETARIFSYGDKEDWRLSKISLDGFRPALDVLSEETPKMKRTGAAHFSQVLGAHQLMGGKVVIGYTLPDYDSGHSFKLQLACVESDLSRTTCSLNQAFPGASLMGVYRDTVYVYQPDEPNKARGRVLALNYDD